MKKPRISIIAAIGRNRELGKDNKLLWHIPEDMKRFRELTSGHTIIMGRKTFESIGRLLPGRINIIVTRNESIDPHKFCSSKKCDVLAFVCNSLEEALDKTRKIEENEVFIIGGGQIYEQVLPLAEKLYLTIVDGTFDADTFFPEYSSLFTKKVFEEREQSEGYSYTFLELER